MTPRTLLRLLRTVRHLRASQLWWRCVAVAGRCRPAPRLAEPDPGVIERRSLAGNFPDLPEFHRDGPSGQALVQELALGRFTHLNRSVDIGRERPDWHLGPVAEHRLWTVTLHYHAWAVELARTAASSGPEADEAGELLAHYLGDWIERCSLEASGARTLAWNSFAVATRMTSWIRAWLRLRERPPRAWAALEPRLVASLWKQAGYLERHLEWDLRGNHLLRDLVGLAWAGRFFTGPDARRWLARSAALVPEQIAEQVLPDGGHFERSATYQLHVMEDLLSLALLLEPGEAVEELRFAWARMAEWLAWLRHPDGFVPLFNDGGMHALCEPARMLALGSSLGLEIDAEPRSGGKLFQDTGLVVWHGDPWDVFFDVGRIGADHVPGHGHADSLSVECSFRGQRVFVDPGTFAYDNDAQRQHDRATPAHNTVCIDGANSSEVWHIFRVGRRAWPEDVRAEFSSRGFRASAAHTGYRHLPGRPLHRRQVEWQRGAPLILVDTLEGRADHHVQGGLLVDPAWQVASHAGGWTLSSAGRRLNVRVRGEGFEPRLEAEPAVYHPDYGVEVATRRLTWRGKGAVPGLVRTEIDEA